MSLINKSVTFWTQKFLKRHIFLQKNYKFGFLRGDFSPTLNFRSFGRIKVEKEWLFYNIHFLDINI